MQQAPRMGRGRVGVGHYMREAVQARVWEAWRGGLSVSQIARAVPSHRMSVHNLISSCGGIRPPARRRSSRALSAAERERITQGVAAGCSLREIARYLKRAPSTISRELKRNGGRLRYSGIRADERAWRYARRPKACLLRDHQSLRELVIQKLSIDWSPQQISGWLKKAYPDDASMRVSHETIYRSLFIQARGVLRKELTTHLRRRQALRIPTAARQYNSRSPIPDLVRISERPAEVEDRAVPGHWEGDLLCGGPHSQVATLVERQSRFVMLVKVATKSPQHVVPALAEHVRQLPEELRRSLTWDRGTEMTHHKRFTLATNMQVYFCDPSSPWQRGSNENTNGLLRQYLHKKHDLSVFSQEQLNAIAQRLNQRPRKALDFRTPAAVFAQAVALTG
jgi:transposase, IS30 family